MKRFFIFLLSLLIAGSAFADGYGKIKWKVYTRFEILVFNQIEKWMGVCDNEHNEVDDCEKLILNYESTKNGQVISDSYICFEKTENNSAYIPQAVIYFIPNTQDKIINNNFNKHEVLWKTTEVFDKSDVPNIKDTYNLINYFSNLSKSISNFITGDKHISKEQNKPTVTVYRYNEDTIAIVYQNCIEGQTLVVYTYHEPDY